MGCDLSKQTRVYFDDRTQEVAKSIKAIKKDQENLKQQLKNITLPMEPEESIQELKASLVPYLERIEKMMRDIRVVKEESSKAKGGNRNDDQKKRLGVSTKEESQENGSRESPNVNKNTKEVMSILEDPTIKAMIEKNKQKFLGKKK
jgi:hypothetical protein